jgi:PAS domain S-box-containing protein
MQRFNPSKRLAPLNRVLLSTITLALASISVLCVSSVFLIRRDSAFKRQLELRAESLANAIAGQSQFALLVSDTAELERMAGLAVSGSEDVLYVVVEDASGKTTAVGRRPGLSPQSIPLGTRTLRTAAMRDLKLGRDRPVDCIEASIPVITQPTAWPLGVESAAPALLGRIRVGMSLEAQHAMFRSTLRYVAAIAALILLVACVIEYFQFRQRQAREKIRKSELRYRELTEMLPQTVFECDLGGKLTMANQTGLQAFGLSREDLERGTDVLDLIVPEERPRAAERLEQLLHDGGRSTHEYTAQCKDGSTFPAVVYASPILSDGKPVGVRGLLIDISERRRVEEALQEWAELLESSNDAIVKVLGTSIVFWNSGAERIFGYWAGEILGQSFDTITPPERRHEIPELLARLERGDEIANFETVGQRRDGRRVDVSLALTPVWDSSGRLIGWVGTSRDITEIKEKQRELLKHNALLKLLQAAAIAANEAATVEEAIQTCLDRICSHTGWSVGHAFLKPEVGKSALVSTGLWHFEEPRGFEPFRVVSEQLAVEAGVGLPGRVLENGAPCWIADLASDARVTRGKLASELGLKAALASPILVGAEVAGVLEFFSSSPPEADDPFLQVITSIGVQLGRVVERTRASGALEESEARYRAITESVAQGILSFDENGRILYANRVAEALFGYPSEELLNLEAVELVPLRLRKRHRQRLRDMTAPSAEENVSLPLFESIGLHRSGREIPIEVSSSRYLAKNNRRVCTALVRDISQRKTLEAQLRQAQKPESIGP